MSRLGGGIGTSGPGETKLEIDRRRIGERITRLKKDLKEVSPKAVKSNAKSVRTKKYRPWPCWIYQCRKINLVKYLNTSGYARA